MTKEQRTNHILRLIQVMNLWKVLLDSNMFEDRDEIIREINDVQLELDYQFELGRHIGEDEGIRDVTKSTFKA